MHSPVGANHSPSSILQREHDGAVGRFLLYAVAHILQTNSHLNKYLDASHRQTNSSSDATHLEKEQLPLRAPEKRMFEDAGAGRAGFRCCRDHLLDQILCYDVL